MAITFLLWVVMTPKWTGNKWKIRRTVEGCHWKGSDWDYKEQVLAKYKE